VASASLLLLLFGALMLVVGTQMLRLGDPKAAIHECCPLRCLTTGVTVGLLTGFLGVGGGFLILPALVLFAGLEMKPAIGTSLAVIAVNCFGGLIGQMHYEIFDRLLHWVFYWQRWPECLRDRRWQKCFPLPCDAVLPGALCCWVLHWSHGICWS
jgi:uncharacterized membrane protein YfcA